MSLLSFETLVIDLTSRFSGLPTEETEESVRQSLAQLVQLLGTDRATLVELPGDPSVIVTSFSHAVGEAPSFPEGSALDLPYYWQQVAAGTPLIWNRLPDDLPAEAIAERAYVEQTGFRSNLTVPIMVGGRYTCALASGTFAEFRDWTPGDIAGVRTVGQLIAGALARQRAEMELRRISERLEAENLYLREETLVHHDFTGIVGKTPVLRHVLDQVSLVAGTDASVLLLGETGTGKELLATAIHERSTRRKQSFVKVNCAAIPTALVESELFGHERGAFTGATATRIGRFELAHEGTLLLDEIGDLPLETQAKLLRVLQDGRFERLGSTATRQADVRIIAATNRALEQAVRAGRFREDLYYRISAFPIQVPPLRERRADIPLLVWSFVERRQAGLGRRITRISRASMQALQAYDWPGNVRELENVLERALILSPGRELVIEGMLGTATGPAGLTMADVERAHIASVLEQAGWRINGSGNAAEVLGLHPNTLRFRMKKLGIRRPARSGSAARRAR